MKTFPILIQQLIPDELIRLELSNQQFGQKVVKSTGWGRITNDIPMINSIVNKTVNDKFYEIIYGCAKTYFGETAIPSYWKWAKYCPMFGTPNIPPHIDINACTYTIDLQLAGNIDWEIYVEGKPYLMKNGDALLYLGSEQMHWRPKFPNNSFFSSLEMCFIHFTEPDHWYHTKGPRWMDEDEIRLPWRGRMLELLPKYKCDTYQPFEDPADFAGY